MTKPFAMVLFCLSVMTLSSGAKAEPMVIDVRVIEATNNETARPDAALKPLMRDLKSLPFRSFAQRKRYSMTIKTGESATFEFPGKDAKKRFLKVKARGVQKNQLLGFHLAIDALRFKSSVSVKDGGTLVVGGPRTDSGTLVFTLTARRKAAGIKPSGRAGRRPGAKRR